MRVLLIRIAPEERAAYAAIASGELEAARGQAALARTRYAAAGPAWADREARMGRLVDLLAAELEAEQAAPGAAEAGAGERRAAA